MSSVYLVAGLGFGDEGKGSIVDFLTRTEKATLVVRYNGGSQAAHHVVLPNGEWHTFSQFGSGTLAGAKTHLSRHMLVNPPFMENEAKALRKLILGDPFKLVTIEREALVTNIYQAVANRLRETLRGKDRHGSCGMGIGETVQDSLDHPAMAIRVGDLTNKEALRKKMRFSHELKEEEFSRKRSLLDVNAKSVNDCLQILSDEKGVEYYTDRLLNFAKKIEIVDHDWLPAQLQGNETIIFEGAQGVLLDQDYGFYPYVTWSDTTFNNAFDLLQGYCGPVRKVGVLRGYMTRHGAGPFPTEEETPSIFSPDKHNKFGEWQQHFRVGYLDFVLIRYALKVIGGVDELAITNLDKIGNTAIFCTHYKVWDANTGSLSLVPDIPVQQPLNLFECVKEHEPKIDLSKQEELTRYLNTVGIDFHAVRRDNGHYTSLLTKILDELKVPVTITSTGPTYEKKHVSHDGEYSWVQPKFKGEE